jgi:DNA-binding CsgD family transcriptional regulator
MSVLHQLFSRTPDAVFAIDKTRHIVFHNSAFEQIFQRPATQITGHECHEVLCGSALNGQRFCGADCRIARDTVCGRAAENFDLVVSKPDKQLVWLSVGACALSQPVDKAAAIFILRPVSALQATSGFAGPPSILLRKPNPPGKALDLTRREQQILKLLTDGLGTAAIAHALHISRITVRRHLQNLFAKLSVHSRTEAVVLAFRNRLL